MQKSRKTGLPDSVKMRHDTHFVELVTSRPTGPRVRMIHVDSIDPNPRQARSELGNIDELILSIKEKGILEPILVRPKAGRYEIIAGERRFVASKKAGLKEIPCIEMRVEDNEAMEIALIENLQRKDLDVFEEADGLKALADVYGYNHEDIAKKIGKARSTITEILNICKIPNEIRDFCKKSNIVSRSTLVEIAKQKNVENMKRLVSMIKRRELSREDTRDLSKYLKGIQKKQKYFVYNYTPKDKDAYRLRIEFKQENVSKEEIIEILKEVIKKLKIEKDE
ncbi:MAG: ParB/RepB/Spo0J family partition protein [Candidatus Aminicenantes bacterium]|nr:MAG: ParB/RepB/Spo0J family partition protein [Candidatus Aminicenantes bacterium]